MKIYNYSDLPIIFDGVTLSDRELHLPQTMVKSRITHNGHKFLSDNDSDRNSIFTISGTSAQYRYVEKNFPLPDINVSVAIFISAFGFFILIKLIQKLKTR